MRNNVWHSWNNLINVYKEDKLYYNKVIKINQNLLEYDIGRRYTIVWYRTGENIKVERPYALPLMTWREFRNQFRYIPGEQPKSNTTTRKRKEDNARRFTVRIK